MSVTEPKPAVPKPKCRRFQYNLRTLLLVVSLGGPCIGWIGIVTKNYLWPRTPSERGYPVVEGPSTTGGTLVRSGTAAQNAGQPGWRRQLAARSSDGDLHRGSTPLSTSNQEECGDTANPGRAAKSGFAGSTSLTAVLSVGGAEQNHMKLGTLRIWRSPLVCWCWFVFFAVLTILPQFVDVRPYPDYVRDCIIWNAVFGGATIMFFVLGYRAVRASRR